jgi:uncharacterized membrane protein
MINKTNMKTAIALGATILSTITAYILGWSLPILSIVNFLWLLVKDVTLFSWWWVVWMGIGFVLSILGVIVFGILTKIFNEK